MKAASTLLIASLFVAPLAAGAQAQSTTPAKKPVARHTATTTSASTLPPNIPKVPGVSKALYALKYTDTLVGTGPLAVPQKFYTVHYTGWLAKDGTKFDSSFDHPGKEPITFPYGAHRVIPGWDTGFEGMHVGGKRRLFIPWQLAYGEAGRAPIPPRADLIFDIELVSFSDAPPTPKTPPAPPKPTTEPDAKPATPDTTKPAPDAAAPDPATPDATKPATPDATKPATPDTAKPQPTTPPHPEGR